MSQFFSFRFREQTIRFHDDVVGTVDHESGNAEFGGVDASAPQYVDGDDRLDFLETFSE